MSIRLARSLAAILLASGLAACASDTPETPAPESAHAITPGLNLTALARLCPQAMIDSDDAYRRIFSPSNSTDPENLAYQTSISQYNRTCKVSPSGDQLLAELSVAGRIVGGPKARAGTVTVPIRVEVIDGANVYYDQVINQQVELPAESLSTQFIFKADNLPIPASASEVTRLRVGIAK